MYKNLPYKYSAGLSLIEILVTVVVLSIGLLGIAGMQAQGVKYSHDSYSRSQATMLVNELIERMHANPDGIANGDYVTAVAAAVGDATKDCSASTNDPGQSTPTKDCAGTGDVCTVTELAQIDYFRTRCGQYLGSPANAYVGGVELLLPKGSIDIQCSVVDIDTTDTNPCTDDDSRIVTVTWQDPDQKETDATLQVQMNARLL